MIARTFDSPILLGSVALLLPAATYFLVLRSVAIPLPFEDAAMLFRYAENLASGHGIVWNAGEAPGRSDGATDLLFVLILAPLVWSGVPSHIAGLIVNGVALFTIGATVGLTNRLVWSLPPVVPLIVTLMVVGNPIWSIVSGGFSAAALGAILTGVALLAVVAVASDPGSKGRTVTFARSGWHIGSIVGLAGWWRPEGFILAPMVLVLAVYAGIRSAPKDNRAELTHSVVFTWLLRLATSYSLLVVAFVIFRLQYFGQLFPTSGTNKFTIPTDPEAVLNLVRSGGALAGARYYASALFLLLLAAVAVSLPKHSARRIVEIGLILSLLSVVWLPFSLTFNW